jgi:hypothetical protein
MATAPVGVSLPGTGVSFASVGVALFTTSILPVEGVSLLGIGVSLVTTSGTSAPGTTGSLDFNVVTNSMYVPILGGFG